MGHRFVDQNYYFSMCIGSFFVPLELADECNKGCCVVFILPFIVIFLN